MERVNFTFVPSSRVEVNQEKDYIIIGALGLIMIMDPSPSSQTLVVGKGFAF